MKLFGKVPGECEHEKIDFKKLELATEFGFPADQMPDNWRISYIMQNPISISFNTVDKKKSIYISHNVADDKYEVSFWNYHLDNTKDTGTKEFEEFKDAAGYAIQQMKLKKSLKQSLIKVFGK